MPSQHVAIFADRSARYAADTCEPLAQAIAAGEVRSAALARGAYPGQRLAGGVLAGVRTVGFWDAAQPQRWGLDWHRNEGLELTLLERGVVSFGVGDARFKLKPGALTVTRPWQPHCVGDPLVPPCRLHWLILDLGVRRPNQPWRWPKWLVLAPADLARLTEILRHNEHAVWSADAEIRQCWQRIARAVETDAAGSSHSRLRVLINELLWLLGEMLHRTTPKLDPALTGSTRTVELFLSELRHNPAQRACAWSVAAMAERCGLGATHFVNLCRELTNSTPAQYLTACRVNAARELLRGDPPASITDIALACGFGSAQYFSTVFRRATGLTPGKFRARGK